MSLKPGIGAQFYEQYKDQIMPRDEIIVRGKPSRPPRYYVDRLKNEDDYKHALLLHQRDEKTKAPRVDLPWRRIAAEKITHARQTQKRDLEL